jgi:hypothetical protein
MTPSINAALNTFLYFTCIILPLVLIGWYLMRNLSPRGQAIGMAAVVVGVSVLAGVQQGWLLGLGLLVVLCVPLAPVMRSQCAGYTVTVGGKQYNSTLRLPSLAEMTPEAFVQMVQDLRAQVNAMLAGLPPLEQFESAQELAYAFRVLTTNAANMLELMESMRASMDQISQKVKVDAEKGAEAKLLEGKEYIKKADADAAATAAADQREKDVRAGLEDEAKALREGETRRTKLVADKVLSETAAKALPADFFKADGYEGRVSKLTARMAKLKAAKVDHAEPFVAEMLEVAFDEAGDKIVDRRIENVKSVVSNASRSGGNGRPPLAPPAHAETTADEIPLVI